MELLQQQMRMLTKANVDVQFITNIIERLNRAEEELNSYRNHMEELVAIRTRELSIARDNAESANQMKSMFLANMSHELRTPLNAILGFTRILIHDLHISSEARKNLEIIHHSGQYLLSIINDALEISCIEIGHTTIHNAFFQLDEMLHDIEDMLQQRAEFKELKLLFYCEPCIVTKVWGDAKRLRQVLINLLMNAIKYTDVGSVVLRTRRVNSKPEEQRIRFEVTDTGPGINCAEQEKIFQAFYQTAHGVAKDDGVGLGLTIAHEFVHLMGGELTVKSTPGCGSCFAFSLPLPEEKVATINTLSTSLTLSAVPNEWRNALRHAAEELDADKCMEIVQHWQQDFSVEANYIVELLKDFKFHQILALCEL